jgi:hypothetical protein
MFFQLDRAQDNHRIDFRFYLGQFDVPEFVHWSWKAKYDELSLAHAGFVADLEAAVFAALSRSGYVDTVVYKKAISCCRDIVIAEGFDEVDEDSAKQTLRNDAAAGFANHVLIAGCQDEEVLDRRVDKAAHFVTELSENCSVVFSGMSPDPSGATPVRIRNESVRMRSLFVEKLSSIKDAKIPRMNDLAREEKSSTTKTNMEQLFQQKNLLNQDRGNNLVIVSSTFHLIRLGREIKALLTIDKNASKVSKLFLIGAEKRNHFFYVQDAEYIKLMMFEVFHYLLTLRARGSLPKGPKVRRKKLKRKKRGRV